VAGCFISGLAGEMASEKKGCHLLPTDIAEEIPGVFRQ
jgi:NAD(P)H-hydrate repair Nnr-like enzyme with NAD(P)H-hydrate dehydratase domain